MQVPPARTAWSKVHEAAMTRRVVEHQSYVLATKGGALAAFGTVTMRVLCTLFWPRLRVPREVKADVLQHGV